MLREEVAVDNPEIRQQAALPSVGPAARSRAVAVLPHTTVPWLYAALVGVEMYRARTWAGRPLRRRHLDPVALGPFAVTDLVDVEVRPVPRTALRSSSTPRRAGTGLRARRKPVAVLTETVRYASSGGRRPRSATREHLAPCRAVVDIGDLIQVAVRPGAARRSTSRRLDELSAISATAYDVLL